MSAGGVKWGLNPANLPVVTYEMDQRDESFISVLDDFRLHRSQRRVEEQCGIKGLWSFFDHTSQFRLKSHVCNLL